MRGDVKGKGIGAAGVIAGVLFFMLRGRDAPSAEPPSAPVEETPIAAPVEPKTESTAPAATVEAASAPRETASSAPAIMAGAAFPSAITTTGAWAGRVGRAANQSRTASRVRGNGAAPCTAAWYTAESRARGGGVVVTRPTG